MRGAQVHLYYWSFEKNDWAILGGSGDALSRLNAAWPFKKKESGGFSTLCLNNLDTGILYIPCHLPIWGRCSHHVFDQTDSASGLPNIPIHITFFHIIPITGHTPLSRFPSARRSAAARSRRFDACSRCWFFLQKGNIVNVQYDTRMDDIVNIGKWNVT